MICTSLLLSITVFAQGGGTLGPPKGKTQRVKFARGRTTAVLKGAVVRGTQDRYILGARAGQSMIVHVTSREKNAVFTILGPDGSALAGTEEGVDATDWTGELPLSGDYSIVVSASRGNATYTLEVTIR
ncbi:MAG: hypothetical protein C5B44_05390 [Acidobacteria bacterium]|nr:MAG: hypothetical protein C5B44_05390 [Acidobacteriota bacterium]